MLNIRPTTVDDAQDICLLRSDISTRSQLHDIEMYSVDQCRKWLKNLDNKAKRFTVIYQDCFVGLFKIDKINYINRHCAVGLDVVKEYRGRGFGKEIYRMMLDEIFSNYNLDLVWLEVLRTNIVGVNLYKKLGFQIDGILRDRILRNNLYIDVLVMSLTKGEWFAK